MVKKPFYRAFLFLLLVQVSHIVTAVGESVVVPQDRVLRIEQSLHMMDEDDEAFRIAHPEITIERVSGEKAEDGNVDIICVSNSRRLLSLAAQGQVAPLSPNADLEGIVQTYEPVFQQALSHNGILYGIPTSLGIYCYVADNAAWRAYGSPPFPTDLDMFFEQVERFASLDHANARQQPLSDILYDLSVQYCVQYWEERSHVNFDTPIYRDLLARGKLLFDQGVETSNLYFASDSGGGKDYTFFLLDLTEDADNNLCIPFLYPTFEKNQTPRLSISMETYAVRANSPNRDIATLYLEFIASNAPEWLQYTLSPTEEVDQTFECLNVLSADLEFYRKQKQYIFVDAPSFSYYMYIDDFDDFLSGVITEDDMVKKLNQWAISNAIGP